jgi:hypothetical protein
MKLSNNVTCTAYVSQSSSSVLACFVGRYHSSMKGIMGITKRLKNVNKKKCGEI